jgi:hypothetical protein
MNRHLTPSEHLKAHTQGLDPARVAAAQLRQAERRKAGVGAVMLGALVANRERTIAAAGSGVELTAEQLDFCTRYGIKPENYAAAVQRRSDRRLKHAGLADLPPAERAKAAARMGVLELSARGAVNGTFGSPRPL